MISVKSNSLLSKLIEISPFIGKTPLRRLRSFESRVYTKLEYNNYSGSIKDRPALKILTEAIKANQINQDTTVIESSSGNFAIALASLCNELGLNFIPVIDPNINRIYEENLSLLCREVIKVKEVDPTGGYLLTRINKVIELCNSHTNFYWTRQYENPNNYRAYYETLGLEICSELDRLDVAFIGVSSCGTITGLSQRLKETFPKCKIIGVDVEGSVIFDQAPKKRHITGIGASMVPDILKYALIDSVKIVSEEKIIRGCLELLRDHSIFGGASAGASYFAMKEYLLQEKLGSDAVALFLCPDKGTAYIDTVYNENWTNRILAKDSSMKS